MARQERTRRAIASEASVELGLGGRAALDSRVHDAVPQVVVQQAERHRLQGLRERADLGEDVDAVLLLLDHPVDAAGLALDALEPGEVPVLVRDVAVVAVRGGGQLVGLWASVSLVSGVGRTYAAAGCC